VGNDCTRPLAPDVRRRLSAFVTATERFLTPATRQEIAAELVSLMVAFRSARAVGIDEAAQTTKAYAEVLSDLPLWAIQEACRLVKLGEVENLSLDFPPAAPHLRKIVSDVMIPLKSDRYDVSKILAAREDPRTDNPALAAQIAEAAAKGLNVQQLRYGKDYGLGSVIPTPPFDQPAMARTPDQAPKGEALVEHYRNHNLAFQQKPQQHGPADDVPEADGYEEMRR
jgi:hypothetical protein